MLSALGESPCARITIPSTFYGGRDGVREQYKANAVRVLYRPWASARVQELKLF